MNRYSTLVRSTTVCFGSANSMATAAISEVSMGYGRTEEPGERGRGGGERREKRPLGGEGETENDGVSPFLLPRI